MICIHEVIYSVWCAREPTGCSYSTIRINIFLQNVENIVVVQIIG